MAHQVVSVVVTRPNYGDRQGMNYLLLGLYVWPLVGDVVNEKCTNRLQVIK